MFISFLFGATYGAEYLKKLLFNPSKEAELKIIPISLLDKDKIQINKEIKVEKKDMIAATPVVTVESGNVSGMLNTVEMNEMITNSLLDWEIIEEKPVFPQLI